MSHTKIEDLEETIAFIQASTSVPICLDSEGLGQNWGISKGEVTVIEHATLEIFPVQFWVTKNNCLYPEYIVDELEIEISSVLTSIQCFFSYRKTIG